MAPSKIQETKLINIMLGLKKQLQADFDYMSLSPSELSGIPMKYLYRALRKEEIDAGNRLIPKSQEPFRSDPCFGIDMTFPIEFGSETNAVRQHQWKRNGFPTSGVSTTPHFEIAKKDYAKRNRVIVKINRQLFGKYGIKEYVVKEYLGKFPEDIAAPEDDEIILVKEDGGSFPKEIIEEVIDIHSGPKPKVSNEGKR